ncbi:MAG: AmmeMemoRadiSam system protein B [Chlorobiaceae bacterium]|nr:AmmeMemoRadiSam system protein B [Chlorobiaceae bacterium]
MKPKVRYPAVAEEFYPSDAGQLDAMLTELFKNANEWAGKKTPKALIVPHAAYRYSGKVSADAYKSVEGRSFRTVILLGNAHSYLFEGIAIDLHDTWRSPFGTVPIDHDMGGMLIDRDPGLFRKLDIAHHCDHVLEVQLPFLQFALKPGVSILPLLFGKNPPEIYRRAADHLLSIMTADDLLVASTDLSHYPSYRNASAIDRETIDHMVKMDIEGLERHEDEVRTRRIAGAISTFCSPDAIKTVLEIGLRSGWEAEEISYQNSGDAVHDDRSEVVGYGAIAFY